jgi:hypothetical protein
MKCSFSILLFLLFAQPTFSEEYSKKYIVKTKGLTIGSLIWKLKIGRTKYESSINLENSGFLGSVYKFSGEYRVFGENKGGELLPTEYFQNWLTRAKTREVKILFKNLKIKEILINPNEEEKARIDYYTLKNYRDPITSFISILKSEIPSYTIDGRRAYLLFPKVVDNYQRILIHNYQNIWADHKRNDLSYIEYYNDKEKLLPKKINIKFKGSIFSIIEL